MAPFAEYVTIIKSSGPGLNGISFSCPKCDCVLGVTLDPFSLQSELKEMIQGLLQKNRNS